MTHKYFEKSDAGLFATVKLMNKRKLLLKNLLRMGDTLNHAIFTLEQINNGLSRLESENYIEFVGNKIYITEKAKRLINSNRKGIFEPCIEELYRYSNPLFHTAIKLLLPRVIPKYLVPPMNFPDTKPVAIENKV